MDNIYKDLNIDKEILDLHNHFSKIANSFISTETAIDLIVKFFCSIYLKDIDGYYSNDKIARSNWTQHTANTFFRTCDILRFKCDFEVENRHDGALRGADGKMYLAAEWEYDTKSIFNPKGEINKLYKTSKKHHCSSFLFTYVLNISFKEFIERVFNQWQELLKSKENLDLYLVTALFEKDEITNINYVIGLRVVVIGKNNIEFWEDFN